MPRPRRSAAVAWVPAAAGIALALPALAQDAPPPAPPTAPPEDPTPSQEAPAAPPPVERSGSSLDDATEVLVTASRREDEVSSVPWNASVVESEEFVRDRARRTLPDALVDLPGVMVQRTSYGQASPFIRGFTGYHTVMLVDGIRLNNSTFRSGPNQYWSTVDALSVDRLEVVRGPSSVLYGSDAVGGVVNAVTRRRTSFEEGLHGNLRTYARYASAEDSWITRVEAEGNQDDLGVLAGFGYRAYGDLRTGGDHDREEQTGYREQDGDLRLDWREAPGAVWTVAYQYVNQDDVPRTHRTVDSVPFHDTTVGDELRRDLTQTRELAYLRHRRETDLGFADAFEATVSFHRQEEVQVRDRDAVAPTRSDEQGVTVETWGIQLQAEKDTRAGFLTYGVEWWGDDVSSFRRDYEDGVKVLDQVQGPVADDASYGLLGIYLQDEVRLGATTVTGGVRWTHASADADTVDDPTVSGGDPATPGNVISLDDSWNDLSASLRAIHRLDDEERWSVFGGLSQGFRAPNLSDLTRLDDTSGRETPSLDLDPEEFLQGEIGVRARQEHWSAQVAYWHTWIDDLIVPSPTGAFVGSTPEVRKDDVGDGWAEGVEADLSVRVADAWTVSVGGTWQDGEVDQLLPDGTKVRRPLSRMMPLTGTFTVTYEEPGAPWRAWCSGRFADAQDQLSLKDETDTERIPPGGTPGYGVLSLGASWDVSRHATASLVVENLFDQDYRIHGSGVNEPGRNLVLALDLRF